MIIGLIVVIAWFAVWIYLWYFSVKKQIGVLVIVSSFFVLFILGVVIGLYQIRTWRYRKQSILTEEFREKSLKIQVENVEMQKKILAELATKATKAKTTASK